MSRLFNTQDAIFSVFFCSPRWAAALDEVPRFLDWATDFFGIQDFIVAAGLGGSTSRSKPLHGSYARLKRKIWQPALVHLVMDDQTSGFRAAVSFENRHPQVPPVYTSYLFPSVQTETYDNYDELKVFSLSIQQNVFHAAVRAHGETALKERLEKLFVDLSCVYGHAWHAPGRLSVATTSTCLIPQTGPIQNKVRVIDYDFSHHIHDLFPYNYLSAAHLAALPDPEHLCDRLSQIDCKMLHDATGAFRGAALYLSENKDRKALTERALSPIMLRLNSPVVGPTYLLLGREQVTKAGGPDALSQFEFVKQTQLFPYGFAKLLCRTYQDPGYSPLDMSNQRLYETIYPQLAGRRQWFEDMVSYPVLKDGLKGGVSFTGVQRLPKPGGFVVADDYFEYAKLFYADGSDLAGLDVWFLLGDMPDLDGVRALDGALKRWLSHLAAHSDAYGELSLIVEPRFLAIGTKMCGHVRANASSIKEEAIDLLMIIMDEINLSHCRVQFVILGEPNPLSEQPSKST